MSGVHIECVIVAVMRANVYNEREVIIELGKFKSENARASGEGTVRINSRNSRNLAISGRRRRGRGDDDSLTRKEAGDFPSENLIISQNRRERGDDFHSGRSLKYASDDSRILRRSRCLERSRRNPRSLPRRERTRLYLGING